MSILALMNRVQKEFDDQPHPFFNKNLALKRSYLTGVAMLAHADGDVCPSERQLFFDIARAFGVTRDTSAEILDRAVSSNEETVLEIRENLMDSAHKYYFILDLLIMATQSEKTHDVETQVVDRFRSLLEIDSDDLGFLKELALALIEKDPESKERWSRSFFKKMRVGPSVEPDGFAFYTHDENFTEQD